MATKIWVNPSSGNDLVHHCYQASTCTNANLSSIMFFDTQLMTTSTWDLEDMIHLKMSENYRFEITAIKGSLKANELIRHNMDTTWKASP